MIVNLLIIGGFVFLFSFIGYVLSEYIEAHRIKDKDNIQEKFEEYLKDKDK